MQTKNTSVCENGVTGIRGSYTFLVMGPCERLETENLANGSEISAVPLGTIDRSVKMA